METHVLPGHTFEVPFTCSRTCGRRVTLVFHVNAEQAVDAFLVDAVGRQAYHQGSPFTSLVASHNERLHGHEVALPYGGPWFVVVRNTKPDAVRVIVDIRLL